MAQDPRLDEWLDEWEAQKDRPSPLPLQAFIERHCAGADDPLVEMFRRRVQSLSAMDRKLAKFGHNPAPPNRPGPAPGRHLLRPGWESLPGYRLLERLGEGGFGEVWKTTAPGNFHAALKFVRLDHRVGDAELRSLDAIKDLRHPHLLSIAGAWKEHGYLIIVMELAQRTLAQRFEEAVAEAHQPGIPRDELLGYFAEAAQGLDFLNKPSAHPQGGNAGVQHRDIKPQNLLLVGGSVKVGDFGVARVLEHTLTGHTGGMTPHYAPPEFLNSQTSSHSDQYSLAVTWCQLRGGRLPFAGNPAQVIAGHLHRPPDLSMLPPEERPAVARALSKKPSRRWPTCGHFVEALRHATSTTSSEACRGAPPRMPFGRRRLAVAVGVFVAALVLGLLLWRGGYLFAPADDDDGLIVAVLDFDNHSGDESLDSFRFGFRDMLVTDLARVKGIKVVERSRLQAVLGEHKLAQGDFINPATASQLGQGTAARSLVVGSYVISGEQVRVDVRLLSVQTGEVQFTNTVTGTRSDVFGLQKGLTARVLAGLGVPVQTRDREALALAQTQDFEAFRLYSEAQQALSRDRQQEAEDRLRKALARDPAYRPALRGLAAIETAALTRLADEDQAQLAAAGQVGQALAEPVARLRQGLSAENGDAALFA